jgi:hypothetical protein
MARELKLDVESLREANWLSRKQHTQPVYLPEYLLGLPEGDAEKPDDGLPDEIEIEEERCKRAR